jgi:predicted PurR-regulated permease PerM
MAAPALKHRISGSTALFGSGDTHWVLSLGVLVAFCWAAQVVLITVFVSVLMALALEPLVKGLERLRLPRSLAALIAVLALSLSVYGLAKVAYREAASFAEKLPEVAREVHGLAARIQRGMGAVKDVANAILPAPDGGSQPVEVRLETNWAGLLAREVASLSELLLSLAFVPFLVYFTLTGQDHLERGLVQLFEPGARTQTEEALREMAQVMRTFLVGNLVLGILTSLVSIPIFALLRVGEAPFVGTLSGFLSVIPYFGVILAIVPPVVGALDHMSGSVFLGIVGTVLGLHLLAINVFYPKAIGERVSLNPLTVTLALLFMGWLWGAAGLLLAIPIAGMLKILCETVDSLHPLGVLMGSASRGRDKRREA